MNALPTPPMQGPSPLRSAPATATGNRARERGAALALTVHVTLLLLVLGQIVYLASRHRTRVDLTSDSLWSTTESTRSLLGKLDKRLVIEAYFSPKEKLPVNLRETRVWADNFLDEMVQLGKGKVVVQRFDPNADKAIADRCQRIGVQQIDLRSSSSTSVSVDRHWQGLRLVYGGGKQKVIPQFGPTSSFVAEAALTPAVKEVTTETKHKFGYMEWPATAIGQQTPGGIGWNMLRTHEGITKRYEFQNLKDEDGALLPAEIKTLFLFRPKDLTDRQKYVLDQFVVGGGTLVVLADAAEYAIGPKRSFSKLPFTIDAAGSAFKFTEQLLHYGIDWKLKVLADLAQPAYMPRDRMTGAYEYLAVPQQSMLGMVLQWQPYPYFFHAVAQDWKVAADDLAKDEHGKVDTELAAQYRKLFVPGMPSDDFLFAPFKKIGRGPGFYWPTWVGLRQRTGGVLDLPQGIDGRVLLWSSPAVLVEDPPQSLDPLGSTDARARLENLQKFNTKLMERFRGEPRQQAPLMVDVRGKFTSFFAGAERPKRPSEIKEEEAKKAEAAAKEKEAEAKPGETPEKPGEKTAEKPGEKPAEKPAEKTAAKPNPDEIGPKPPVTDNMLTEAPPEPAMRTGGDVPGRIVVIGDADFLRDDLVRGDYRQAGGPVSINGPPFFSQLLDWLAEDRDLVALQSRIPEDRTLKFVDTEATPNMDTRLSEQTLAGKTNLLVTLNVAVPCALLALFGLLIFGVRRAQKRSFLASSTQ
ncbi:MAG TPA: GldG family protein [Planctomycetota bacterium]|nr:GldG family protein [Planctomycetota bacterium]